MVEQAGDQQEHVVQQPPKADEPKFKAIKVETQEQAVEEDQMKKKHALPNMKSLTRATGEVPKKGEGLRVMTFNAGGLVEFDDDQSKLIDDKITYIKSLLEECEPDVLCIQESMIPMDLLNNDVQRNKLGFKGYTLYCKTVKQYFWDAKKKWMSPHGQMVYVRDKANAEYLEVGDFKNTVMVIPNKNTDAKGQLTTSMKKGDELRYLPGIEEKQLLATHFDKKIQVKQKTKSGEIKKQMKALHEIINEEGRLMVFKFPQHNIVLVSAYVFYNDTKKSKYDVFYNGKNPVIEPRDVYDKNIQTFLTGVLAHVRNLNPNYDLVYAGDLNATVLNYKNDEKNPTPNNNQNIHMWFPLDGCNSKLVEGLQAILANQQLALQDPFQPNGQNPHLITIMSDKHPADPRCSKVDHIFVPKDRRTENPTIIVTQELVEIIKAVAGGAAFETTQRKNTLYYKALVEYIERTSDHLPSMVYILPKPQPASATGDDKGTPAKSSSKTSEQPGPGQPGKSISEKNAQKAAGQRVGADSSTHEESPDDSVQLRKVVQPQAKKDSKKEK